MDQKWDYVVVNDIINKILRHQTGNILLKALRSEKTWLVCDHMWHSVIN